MDIETILAKPPDPRRHSFPDYSLPRGEPVFPIAVTRDELAAVLDLYRRSRPSASGLDPEGEGRKPR